MKEGINDNIVIVPRVTKRESKFNDIVDAVKNNHKWVLPEKYSQNSVYVLLRKIREVAKINCDYGKTDTGQFVVFKKVEEKKTK